MNSFMTRLGSQFRSLTSSVHFYQDFAPVYDQLSVKYGWNSPDVMFGLMIGRLNLVPKALAEAQVKMLDVGIGTGLSSAPFANFGMNIYGVDGSANMIELCRRKGFAERLDVVELSTCKLPYETNYFDAAICNGVLYFFDDLGHIFSEVSRVLKPGALFGFNFEPTFVGDQESYENDANSVLKENDVAKSTMVTYRHNPLYMASLMRKFSMTMVQELSYLAYHSPTTGEDVFFSLYVVKVGG